MARIPLPDLDFGLRTRALSLDRLQAYVEDHEGRLTQLETDPGTRLFVDGVNGSDNNAGTTWATAFKTLQAAVNASVSGHHDKIFVKDGTYAENVVVSQKDYLTMVGISANGYGRPDVVPAAGLALLVDRSQGFVAVNIRFASNGQDSDVVRVEGNGWRFNDCVLDGNAGMGATKAILRLWCDAADDSFTASEGRMSDCLVRGSGGYGIAFDIQHATVGVGVTHCVFEDVRFISNAAEDIIALATAAGTYSLQDNLFVRCYIGMGTSKNKATHIDIETNNGATNTGNVFAQCFINDDTINTTAVKAASTGSSFIGCYSLDGVIDGDLLD